jgi:hypothetical protein
MGAMVERRAWGSLVGTSLECGRGLLSDRVAGFQLSSCDAVARDAVELIPSGTYAGGSISQCSFAYRLRLGRPRCEARWGLSVSASYRRPESLLTNWTASLRDMIKWGVWRDFDDRA